MMLKKSRRFKRSVGISSSLNLIFLNLIIISCFLSLSLFFLSLSATPVSASVKTLGSITDSSPTIRLEFSDPVIITDVLIYYSQTLGGQETQLSLEDLGTSLAELSSSTTDHQTYLLSLSNLENGYYRIIISKEPYGEWATGELADDQVLFVITSSSYFNFIADISSPRILYHSGGGIAELWDNKKPAEVLMVTDDNAVCYYESSGSYFRFSRTGETIHKMNFSTSKETSFKCVFSEESGGSGPDLSTSVSASTQTGSLLISYIDQPLNFNISFSNDYIVDLSIKNNTLKVIDSTNGPLFCFYQLAINDYASNDKKYFSGLDDSVVENYLSEPSISIPLDVNERGSFQNYTVSVTCEDKSGRLATVSKSFYLNYTNSLSIKLLSPTNKEQSSELNITVGVEGSVGDFVSLVDSHCYLDSSNTDFISEDEVIGDDTALLHTIILDNLEDGTHDAKIICEANDKELSKTFSFTIDTEPPAKPNITTSKAICSGDLSVSINCDDDYCDDLFFQYAIYKGSSIDNSPIFKENSSDDAKSFDLKDLTDDDLDVGDSYLLEIIAFDKAGNPSDPAYKTLSVEDPTSTLCDHTPPSINVTQTQLSSGAIEVMVSCEDDPGGSGCSDTFDYSLLAPGIYTCTYTNTSSLNSPLLITASSKLCIAVKDLNDNTAYHTETIIVSNFSVDHCSNGEKDFELGETDVDCGGVCDPCEIGLACEENYDCNSGTCVDNLCSAPSCDDGILNGEETGVDCGGPDCDPCSEGASCDNDYDCENGYSCIYGVCTLTGGSEVNNSSNKTGEEWWSIPEDDGGKEDSEHLPSEHDEEETNWWALSLIIIGLLMMVGGGSWAYYEYELKNGIDIIDKLKGGSGIVRGRSLNSGLPSGLNNNLMGSPNRLPYSRRTKSSSSSFTRAKHQSTGTHYHDAAHKIEERLKSKRESLLGAFDNSNNSNNSNDAKKNKVPAIKGSSEKPGKKEAKESSSNKSSEESSADDGFDFIDIRDLGSKDKKHTKELTDELNKEDVDLPDHLKSKIKKKKKLKKIDDTFKELDELLK